MSKVESPPDSDTFSTPPTTPTVTTSSTVSDESEPAGSVSMSRDPTLRPSGLSRRASARLGSIRIDSNQHNDLVIAGDNSTPSPETSMNPNLLQSAVHRHQKQQDELQQGSAKSPCFVHSWLDQGASLADWLNQKSHSIGNLGIANSLEHPGGRMSSVTSSSSEPSPDLYDEDEDDYTGSLTRQLAETANGVREMSKQLGQARIRSNIQNVLIVTKARDNRLVKLTRELAIYLMNKRANGNERGLVVYVDGQLRHSKRFDAVGIEQEYPEFFRPYPRRRASNSSSSSLSSDFKQRLKDEAAFTSGQEGQLRYWTSEMCSQAPHLFDFVVTLGGDGTVLFTSWLFQRIVPPVLPFALGSLGFLTNFDFADHKPVMDAAIDSGIRVNLRMRFTCTVYRAVRPEHETKGRRKAIKKGETGEILMRNIEKDGWEALEGGWSGTGGGACGGKDKEIMCFTTRPVESFEVINDLVVDRGPSPFVSMLELFGDEHHMTTVQADGLTVSTPTGSTAYSLSAGGSLAHPEIPAILITPICPHTLSFRPMLLPDSMELRICVPFNSRSTAWASFDGRGRVELKQGDHIKVTASRYPFPTVCADTQSTDWFHSISRTLKWNERERQKSFVVVEEGPMKPSSKPRRQPATSPVAEHPAESALDDEEEDDEEEEEEESFDIDDSSAESKAQSMSIKATAAEKAAEMIASSKKSRDMKNALQAIAGVSGQHPYSKHGIDSPDRFGGPHPHPPRVSPRHVSFGSSDPAPRAPIMRGDNGDRDDIRDPPREGTRSRIPKDRGELSVADSMKTPTIHSHPHHINADSHPRRAFAVWGHDESDSSNTSDIESDA